MEDFPNVDYEILKPDQVLKLMDEEIGKVETLLDVRILEICLITS